MNISFLTILCGIWLLLTLSLVALSVYRGIIGRNEETELMVDQAEHRFKDEQQAISAKVEMLSKPIRFLGIAVGGLLLVIIVVWIYTGLQNS